MLKGLIFVPGERGRFIHVVIGVIITIFLGAIGSGLWQLVLAPFIERLSSASLHILAQLFRGYTDRLYRPVSRDPGGLFTVWPYVTLVTTVIVMPWAALVFFRSRLHKHEEEILSRIGDKHDNEPAELPKHELPKHKFLKQLRGFRRFITLTIVLSGSLSTILYSEELFSTIHTRRAFVFLDRSL